MRSSPLLRSLLTAGGLCSAQPQACQVLPAHAGPPQSSLRLLCSHFMLQVAQSTEGREDRQFSALLGTGSMLPIFMKEVRCPQFSVPPRESLPARAGCLCVGRGGRAGGWVGADCIAHRRSQLPLDAEKSNFLPNCHRPRALPSQPTCACRSFPPPIPLLLPPAAYPTADAAPPRGHPCRDAPYIMSAAGRGWGAGRPPPRAP